MTKLEALDKFCLFFDFATNGLPGETRVQFLNRKQKEWAIEIINRQIQNEEELAKQTSISTKIAGLDI